MATPATRPATSGRTPALHDRYVLADGRVFLTGVQALVRVLLDQHRADLRAGLRTATLVSGYPGSPLAGFSTEVGRLGPVAGEHELVLRPAVNEELAATAVWGSQLASNLPGPRFDGVLGVWYGKSPGVDRAADAIRHGNFVGTDPRGGVLAICGDDPASKSSTIPGASEGLLAALHVPVLAPGSVQEVLDLGRHAIACSRASGLWAALKVVTAVADAAGTAEVGLDRVTPALPLLEWDGGPYVHRPSAHLLAPDSLELERTLTGVRLELARRYARMNGLNPITHAAPGARLGIVAGGTAYHDLLQALDDLGLGDDAVRIIKVGMLYPLDPEPLRAFAAGLDEVLVIEEKGPFLERLVKEALYGMPSAPRIVGARDERGVALVPAGGALGADAVARAVGARVLGFRDHRGVRARLERLDAIALRRPAPVAAQRTPFFCSGCPHSSSTVADDDAIVGAGIGCHTMVLLNPAGRGQVSGITQMGGEGAQWIGVAPFIAPRHFVQNLGDGTFHHSGSLAIRAAVAARLDVTYKLLYNDTVAMTGGQHVEGQMDVAALARSLHAEGVARVVITADDPDRYHGVALPAGTEVRSRARLLETQRELARIPGVTVLIHDQACAAELRRARKRGSAPEPPKQVLINERVCEGCGDCGTKSGCLSVEPVETEFGRKTRIHQASCNKDYSCLEGDCPSFLTIIPAAAAAPRAAPGHPLVALPDPVACVAAGDLRLRLVGVGGTGVVTINQVLGMAALLDGLHASGLDQTGLSQKAGPVVSDMHLSAAASEGSVAPSSAAVDVLLAFDMLGAVGPATLRAVEPGHTVAIVSTSIMPTGRMVIDPAAVAPDAASARGQIDAMTCAGQNVYLDAEAISQALFADSLQANVVLLGAAWQQGAIPLSRQALHDALRLNGTAVERNIAAFEWGRAAIAAPASIETLLRGDDAAAPERAIPTLVDRVTTTDHELRRLLAVRVDELCGFGGPRAARRYIDVIERVHGIEQARMPGGTALTEAVARGLYKLTAYKDEYEVARLHVEGVRDLPAGAKISFHLHPPLLRALGMRRKLRLGRWFLPVLRVLRHGRRLRGTPLDVFGYSHVRRVERRLPGEYLALVERTLPTLSPATIERAVEVAQLPDLVRGYEEIKLAGVERFRARADELLAELPRV